MCLSMGLEEEGCGDNYSNLRHIEASLMAQTVKDLPAVQETQVQSLGWEDLLEKGMATHSSIPAWRIPQKKEPGTLQSLRLQRVRRLHD